MQAIQTDFASTFDALAVTNTTSTTPASASASATDGSSSGSPPKKRSNTGSGGAPKEPSQPNTVPGPVISSSTMADVLDKVHMWTWKLQQHLTLANHHYHEQPSSLQQLPFSGTFQMFEFDSGTSMGVGGGVHGVASGCVLEVRTHHTNLFWIDCDCYCFSW